MRRDRTDEASIRQLLDQAVAARLSLRENEHPNTDEAYLIGWLLEDCPAVAIRSTIRALRISSTEIAGKRVVKSTMTGAR
jgi:hypothetical protein